MLACRVGLKSRENAVRGDSFVGSVLASFLAPQCFRIIYNGRLNVLSPPSPSSSSSSRSSPSSLGTLRFNDAEGNKNVKKNNRFYEQNNNFVRASHFFVHFFPVFARLRRENA